MQKLGLNELRERFLAFFETKGHLRAPSAPLVPQGDQSLLFINSGMAPLKPYFSGEATPPRKRMATCQKCVRTPDIENVGKTSRHGTFFEMLGNFSFGDYFKRDAAFWAWEFITVDLQIPKELLHISVYVEDDETYDLWTKEVGIDPSHMVRLGKKDNFWEIGSGPCGPCSEIYFDRGEENGCHSDTCAVGCDCDRYVEFWNLVFTQFHNDGEGHYTPLAQKNIDTGMGLERLACIMQGVGNLFEVDTIQNVLAHVTRLSGKNYKENDEHDISLRVITDHIRSVTFMVCDGALPSNEGRGYVLRRLLRRAARHGRLLGISGAFLHEVCETVIQESGDAYPLLRERRDYIKRVIRVEEDRFEQTIDAGLKLLFEMIDATELRKDNVLSGEHVFKLYDTYGFPQALTMEILAERGLSMDETVFDRLMGEQRLRARTARAAMGDFGWQDADLGIDKTLKTEFVGYNNMVCETSIQYILTPEGPIQSANEGDKVTLLMPTTPFYAEGGGQVADFGEIYNEQAVFKVLDCKKTKDGQYLHIGYLASGELAVGQLVTVAVDKERRNAIQRAHSATHLLQRALRDVLGTHVEQSGSYVEPDRLRFDFTHFSTLSQAEIDAVRTAVNDMILEGVDVTIANMSQAEAQALGAMALFGEKYGDVVRVVRMGDCSIELCGGTHVSNTAKIGIFNMRGDSSVAAGVRRIEAHVGKLVMQEHLLAQQLLANVQEQFKAAPEDLKQRVEQHVAETKLMRREIEQFRVATLQQSAKLIRQEATTIGTLQLCVKTSDSWDADALRVIGDQLKQEDTVAVLASTLGDKLTFLAVCGKNAVAAGVKAGDIIKSISAATDGSGGGRPDTAMGGGKDVAKLAAALQSIASMIQGKLGG